MASFGEGALLLFVALALVAGAAAQTQPAVLTWDPDVAVRGHHLVVNVFITGDTTCTLSSEPEGAASPSSVEGLNSTKAVEFLVYPATPALLLNLSLQCEQQPPIETVISITSDVDLQTAMATSPSPADQHRSLVANFTVVNKGGHRAYGVTCNITSTQAFSNNSCKQQESLESVLCPFDSLGSQESTLISLGFDDFADDTNVTVTCWADTLPQGLVAPSTFSIYLKTEAKIKVTAESVKVVAGNNVTAVTTIANEGRADANELVCDLPAIDGFTFVGTNDSACALANATLVSCNIGTLAGESSRDISLHLLANASVLAGENKLTWKCRAQSLSDATGMIPVETSVTANIGLALPANSSIPGDGSPLLFNMTNAGPSYVRNATCEFVVHAAVEKEMSWSSSHNFNCSLQRNDANGAVISCDIAQLPPGSEHFNLGLHLVDRSIGFAIQTSCKSESPTSTFAQDYNITVAARPSPSPRPIPTGQTPDNTMVVVVTVVVAMGLLIVVVIWWRRKQERAGWDAAGPSPRSPSLNRFSEMELSIRSDD